MSTEHGASPSECPTILLPDRPSDKDEVGPHHRIAAAIAELVRDEPGGVAIGLSGSYGSGKSTVVNLVSQELKSETDHLVWVFDAWAHEGDPLRRIFLERLIRFLMGDGPQWVERDKWTKRIEELAKRRKITSRRTLPRLSRAGWLLAGSALLIPVGSALFAEGLRQGASLRWAPLAPHPTAFPGLLLVLAPVWTYFLIRAGHKADSLWKAGRYIWSSLDSSEPAHRRLRKVFSELWANRKNSDEDDPERENALHEALALFVQRTVTDEQTLTYETPDPTSIEFERRFYELLREALSKSSRRLVLVVDNLDRISADKALAVWSTLQTFLHHGDGRGKWLRQLWLLVPYDDDAIRNIWNTGKDALVDPASAFLDKSFQIRFHVPVPLQSDWREYLIDQLATAFPAHAADEFHKIYRLFRIRRREASGAPSPREMKLVVNQIGALHRERCHEIPLVHLAYFVLLRRDDEKVTKQLIEGALPAASERGLLDASVKLEDSLAALAFGVALDEGSELLLQGPLLDVLGRADADGLADHESKSPGFWPALEVVVHEMPDEWLSGESGKILHAVKAVQESAILERAEPALRHSITQGLRSQAEDLETLWPLTSEVGTGLVALLTLIPDEDLAKQLWTAYSETVAGMQEYGNPEASLAVSATIEISTAYSEMGWQGILEEGIEIPDDMDGFLRTMSALVEQRPEPPWKLLKLFRARAETAEIPPYLQELVTSGRFKKAAWAAVRRLRYQRPKAPWQPLIAALTTRLQAGQGASQEELVPLISALSQLTHTPEARQSLTNLGNQGHLAHQYNASVVNEDQDAAGVFLYLMLAHDATLTTGAAVGSSNAGYEDARKHVVAPPDWLVEQFVRKVRLPENGGVLLRALEAHPTPQGLPARTLAQVIENGRAKNVILLDDVVEYWDAIAEIEASSSLVAALLEDERFSKALSAKEFGAQYAATASTALEVSETLDAGVLQWCLDGLRDMTAEEWEEHIGEDSEVIGVALTLEAKGVEANLEQPLHGALEAHAKGLLDEDEPSRRFTEWERFTNSLDANYRTILQDNLRQMLKSANGDVGGAFFAAYGGFVASSQSFRDDKQTITHILMPLVDKRNVAGIRWIRSLIAADPDWLPTLGEAYENVFRKRIAEELRNDWEAESEKELKALADDLGISPSKKRSRKRKKPKP